MTKLDEKNLPVVKESPAEYHPEIAPIQATLQPVETPERVCEAPDCDNAFVPLPHGSRQIYCSEQCRSRTSQRRYRERLVKKENGLQLDDQIDVTDVVESTTAFTSLSPHQKAILKVTVDNFLLEIIETDAAIAEKVGCHPQTVLNARHSTVFQHAIGEILPQLAKVKSVEVLQKIYNWIDKDWKAGKYVHELAGVFVQRSQQAILHGRMDTAGIPGRISSPEAYIDEACRLIGGKGWTLELFIEKFSKRWRELQNEGAF